MSAPKPHDPRTPRITADEVDQRVSHILSEEAATLADVVTQLSRAHDVVQAALQQ